MIPQNLDEANQLILRKIAASNEQTILGFLPLTQAEEEAVLDLVRDALKQGVDAVPRVILRAPAATLYGLAVAPARKLTDGGKFWPAFEEDLGIKVPPGDRSAFANRFRREFAHIGLLNGTIEGAGWVHAAPFIFQAGILHYWVNALAAGLKSTLKTYPTPDLEDPGALTRFTQKLRERIYNQPILDRILGTDVGPLLVRKLVSAYVHGEWCVLPPHLEEAIKGAFSTVESGMMLRSPYLAYDLAFGNLQVVLPAVSPKLASEESYWRVNGRRYAARKETRILASDLSDPIASIELGNLKGQLEKQAFSVNTRVADSVPFRVFRHDTGREKPLRVEAEISLPPGRYIVVMAKGILTNDENIVKERGNFRELEGDLRPGIDPLILQRGEERWTLDTALTKGFYIDRGRASVVSLSDGELLHYGEDLGLVAYFPARDLDHKGFRLWVQCKEQGMDFTADVASSDAENRAFVFQDNLQPAVAEALSQLEPGVHFLQIALSNTTNRVEHRLWYWKGLEQISMYLGFTCSHLPKNLQMEFCRGLKIKGDRLVFEDNYHAPTVTLALKAHEEKLELPRAGVRAVIVDPRGGWEDEPAASDAVVVTSQDRRVLKVESGGFQCWQIMANHREIAVLDKKRTSFMQSLRGVVEGLGGAVNVEARNDEDRSIKLLSLVKPLMATQPKHLLNHSERQEIWKFKVAVNLGCEIGVSITDLSDDPTPEPATIQRIVGWQDGNPVFEESCYAAATILLFTSEDEEECEAARQKGHRTIHAQISSAVDEIAKGLWAIDFHRRDSADSEWAPLECDEKFDRSSRLRFYAWGDALPGNNAGWWPRLRVARQVETEEKVDPKLAAALSAMKIPELEVALRAYRVLAGWKYPSSVWKKTAHRLQGFPVHLGRHRFNALDESARVWWREGVAELAEYARTQAAPVVRQFLLASQPNSLRIPPSRLVGDTDCSVEEDLMVRSLNLGAEIVKAGRLKDWLLKALSRDEANPSLVVCFKNFREVHTGAASEFKEFNLFHFLEEGLPGVVGLREQVVSLDKDMPRFSASVLLSPEHLLHAVRAMKRRCRLLDEVAEEDGMMTLTNLAQAIERMAQKLDFVSPKIAEKLGWVAPGRDPWWTPPLKEEAKEETVWSKKVADLVWVLAAISRLAAHYKISPEEYDQQLKNLLCVEDGSSQTVQNRISILLSLAPELFAFLVALFELQFPVEPKNGDLNHARP